MSNVKIRSYRIKKTEEFKTFLRFEDIFQKTLEAQFFNIEKITYSNIKELMSLFKLNFGQVIALLRGKIDDDQIIELKDKHKHEAFGEPISFDLEFFVPTTAVQTNDVIRINNDVDTVTVNSSNSSNDIYHITDDMSNDNISFDMDI